MMGDDPGRQREDLVVHALGRGELCCPRLGGVQAQRRQEARMAGREQRLLGIGPIRQDDVNRCVVERRQPVQGLTVAARPSSVRQDSTKYGLRCACSSC
jgi:hypothetical protein